MKYKATNIKYDLEGHVSPNRVKDVLSDLPKEIIVEVDDDLTGDELEDKISDVITAETGFCHKGYLLEKIDEDKEIQEVLTEVDNILTDYAAVLASLFMNGVLTTSNPIYSEIIKIKQRGDTLKDKIKEYKK